MRITKVCNVRKLIAENPTTVSIDTSLKELVLAITEDPKTRSLYVVDEKRKLQGIITVKNLVKAIFPYFIDINDAPSYMTYQRLLAAKVEDIMYPNNIFVKDDENLETALDRMYENDLEEIPVVDDDMRVIGELDLLELLTAWLEKAVISGDE